MLHRKWKIKSVVVLDVRSAAHLEAFWMKQGVILHVSNVLGMCRGACMRSHTSYAKTISAMARNHLWCAQKLNVFFKIFALSNCNIIFTTNYLNQIFRGLLLRVHLKCSTKLLWTNAGYNTLSRKVIVEHFSCQRICLLFLPSFLIHFE